MTTYTYDSNGNLEVENASGTRTTHTWNDENQLTQVAKTGMTTNQYTFNGDGQRVQIVDSQGTKKPIWDFENVLLETDGSNVTQVVYTLEPTGYGNLISQRRASSSYYLFDALGSTRKLVDFSGTVTDSYDFRAYGETYASSGSTTNVFRWVGELGYYYDIDRLAYYLRARPYSPALARFLSLDPLGFRGSQWNLYEYVRCRPTMYSDPTGRRKVIGPGGGVIGALCSCYLSQLYSMLISFPIEWTNADYAHCVAACRATKACGGGGGAIGGACWELVQEIMEQLPGGGGGGQLSDQFANFDGVECAGWEAQISGPFGGAIGLCFRTNCADCCKQKYKPKPAPIWPPLP